MQSISVFFKKAKEKIKAEVFAVFYKRRKSKRHNRLVNKEPTIISYDCTGAYIYHDLGLMFRSPTVNLRFGSFKDFFTFVNHLEYYCSVPIEQVNTEGRVSDLVDVRDYREDSRYTYPIGILRGKYGDIILMFVHTPDVNEAFANWTRRAARIKTDNLFLVMHVYYWNEDVVSEFKSLGYKNKLMLTYSCPYADDEIYNYKFTKEYVDSLPFTYKGWFGKRNMDEYDFAAWLDRGYSGKTSS